MWYGCGINHHFKLMFSAPSSPVPCPLSVFRKKGLSSPHLTSPSIRFQTTLEQSSMLYLSFITAQYKRVHDKWCTKGVESFLGGDNIFILFILSTSQILQNRLVFGLTRFDLHRRHFEFKIWVIQHEDLRRAAVD